MLDRLNQLLNRIEILVVSILLLSILAFSIWQIVLRNIFDAGIIWGDSLVRVLVLWLGLVGALIASRNGKQIKIDIISQLISKRYHYILQKINHSFSAIICLIISYYSSTYVYSDYISGTTVFASVPVWIAEIIIPIVFILLTIRYAIAAMTNEHNISNNT